MSKTEAEAVEIEVDHVGDIPFEFKGETFYVKKKFKRLKFLRMINRGDLFDAFELAVPEDQLDKLEDLDLEENELEELLQAIAEKLVGSKGNS